MILLHMLRRVFIGQAWASPTCLTKCMSVCTYCLYILYVCGEPSRIYGGLYHDATHSHNYLCSCNTQVSECKVQAMNRHNMDGDHSQTCLFNSCSNGGYHTTPWQARVISSVDAISISAVLYRTWCAGRVARAVYIYIYMYIYGMSVIL